MVELDALPVPSELEYLIGVLAVELDCVYRGVAASVFHSSPYESVIPISASVIVGN